MDGESLKSLALSLGKAGLPFLAKIIGGSVGGPLGVIVAAVIPQIAEAMGLDASADPGTLASAIDAAPSAASEKLAAIEQAHKAALDFANLQVQQNMKEAESSSLFIAGWRPAFGWSCVIWITVSLGWTFSGHELPVAFLALWNPVWIAFGGMLGLRTIEKWGGVARETLKAVLPSQTKVLKRK